MAGTLSPPIIIASATIGQFRDGAFLLSRAVASKSDLLAGRDLVSELLHADRVRVPGKGDVVVHDGRPVAHGQTSVRVRVG